MKVFIAFAICLVAVFVDGSILTKKIDKKPVEYNRQCIAELKLDPRLIDDLEHATTPTLRESACFLACLDKKTGLMNEDGTYNYERFMSFATTPEEREEVEKVYNGKLKNCTLASGNDVCKTAACAYNMPQDP